MPHREPIAIVGRGGIFPKSPDLKTFWSNLNQGLDTSREVPQGRWPLSLEEVFDPNLDRPDMVYSKRGCFIEDFQLIPEGLSLEGKYIEKLDPMFHLALHAGREAFQNAVTQGLDRERIGVIMGNIALPTEASSRLGREIFTPLLEEKLFGTFSEDVSNRTEGINRYVAGLPAGVLAKALHLGGGSYTLDAACASSLYALKLAADELLAGRADAMLTGGLSRPDPLYTQMGFSQLHALSPTGKCSPFDAKGNGLVVGEGAGILVLKRLSDALHDGDTIYALIRGIGLSNDVGGSLLAPNSEGQLRAMRAAYAEAGWSPEQVDLIECHATGTPVGDAVEFESLMQLWGKGGWKAGQCTIGSVKSNIGHLLTAAGSAGLIKVLLALENKTLPPTANFETPAAKVSLAGSPFQVLSQAKPWERRDEETPRRAAVSAFGFGGINAHVLLEEWVPPKHPVSKPKSKPSLSPKPSPIAIIGMEAHFGKWKGLRAFQERVLGGGHEEEPWPQKNNWGAAESPGFQKKWGPFPPKGFYVDELQVPLDQFRIPPKELEEMLPQQLLMLQVAAAALADSGIKKESLLSTGVFIGIGLDLNTTHFHLRWSLQNQARLWNEKLGFHLSDLELKDWTQSLREAAGPALNANRTMGALGGIVASRIAREFRVGGPSFTLSSEESSGLTALEAAVRLLQKGELDQAIVGAVDLAGDLRSVLGTHAGRPFSPSEKIRPMDAEANGSLVGEGAAAVILKRLEDAVAEGYRIYAVIQGLSSATGGAVETFIPETSTYQTALKRAYEEARVDPNTITYLETHGSGNAGEDRMEALALSQFFGPRPKDSSCALGSVKADIGHSGAASGLASLVKASLCLYQEILPPLRNLKQPRVEYLDKENPFSFSRTPRYWLRNRSEGPRRAGVSAFSMDGNCLHVVLEGFENNPSLNFSLEKQQPLGAREESLFTIEGENVFSLLEQLAELHASVQNSFHENIEAMARRWWREKRTSPFQKLGLALVARNAKELLELIHTAESSLRDDPKKPITGKGLLGERIFYSPEPLSSQGKIAFVFPGSGNHYPDMGRELSVQWAEVFRQQDWENETLRDQLVPEYFWSEGKAPTPQAMILGQVALGSVMTDLFRKFGVNPQAVIGYSLGESTGLISLKAWTARDEMLRRIQSSTLFTEDLAPPYRAARDVWKIPEREALDWAVGVLDRPEKVIRAALHERKKVYLLIVNTPHECVVGGERKALEELTQALGCHFLTLEGVITVHCELFQPVKKPYRDLHLFPTTPPSGIRFYSAALGKSYEVNRESAADSIVAQALEGFDFSKTIQTAYQDGVRLFLEMGPGNSCSRMIDKILNGRPHLARSACVIGQDSVSMILRLLGSLIAEGVPVDLGTLYGQESSAVAHREESEKPSSRTLKIEIGGKPFQVKGPPTHFPQDIPTITPVAVPLSVSNPLLEQMAVLRIAQAKAHETFLRLSAQTHQMVSSNLALQMSLLEELREDPDVPPVIFTTPVALATPVAFDWALCLEFAVGSIVKVLGPDFAEIESHPTRVRLPGEPLMLVDRILSVTGEPQSLKGGRVVTEHDIHPGAWYLDGGRIPICIAVEAGQADLFLSGYLGIDFKTKGLAVYRLLDAVVTFHRPLPGPGEVIRYEIQIERFFSQGDTTLFYFNFEGTVNGEPLLTMKNGCAGFFTAEALAEGKGIVHTELDRKSQPGKKPLVWEDLVPLSVESYSELQIEALRSGNLATCFGPLFKDLPLKNPLRLPGGRMKLVDRILHLDPQGGRFGLGLIRGEADIHPDDWFLTCHFVDDRVMPGTLMYECCLHTLRIFLLRMGWVGEEGEVVCEPVPGIPSGLKCRGQVVETTQKAIYEISIKEIDYRPEPYVIADALMFADGKPIVEITNLSIQLSGLTRERIQDVWRGRNPKVSKFSPEKTSGKKSVLFDHERILAFAIGTPSEAFGEPYTIFDEGRIIARLPGPPYQFLDRITKIDALPWKMVAGGVIEAEYDIPPEAWYFKANGQNEIPFAVLLEIALQPCGWLAAYVGSALTSEVDLSFRNLGGNATPYEPVHAQSGTLQTKVKITKVASSGGMIIQNYDFEMFNSQGRRVYQGDTYFGFFSKEALSEQVGIRNVEPYSPTEAEIARGKKFEYPHDKPFPDASLRMIDHIDLFVPEGGPKGLGFIRGIKDVDPEEWFFKAHFYQDPVCPGSLGLESFLQLLKFVAAQRWGNGKECQFETPVRGRTHHWIYRGQILPTDRRVTVEAVITSVDEDQQRIHADGFLKVDGRIIYQMNDFTLSLLPSPPGGECRNEEKNGKVIR